MVVREMTPISSNLVLKTDTVEAPYHGTGKRRSRSAAPSGCRSIETVTDTNPVKTKKLKGLMEKDEISENDSNHSYHDPYSQMYVGGHDPGPADVTTIPTSDPDEAQEEALRGRSRVTSNSSSVGFRGARKMSDPYQNHSAGSSFYAHVYNGDVFRKVGEQNSLTLPESVDLSSLGLDNAFLNNHDSGVLNPAHTASDHEVAVSENIGGVADTSAVLPPINDRKRIPLDAYLKFWSNVDYICSRLPKETPTKQFPILTACVKGPLEINQSNGLLPEAAQYVKEQRKQAIAKYGHSNAIQSEQYGVVDYLHHSLGHSFEAVASGNIESLLEIIRTLESGSKFLRILVNLDGKVRERAEEMSVIGKPH